MNRFDGTAARQLDLMDDAHTPIAERPVRDRPQVRMRLLRKDLYAELNRRRRRAQIAARHELDRS
jgi:hypothetical protein